MTRLAWLAALLLALPLPGLAAEPACSEIGQDRGAATGGDDSGIGGTGIEREGDDSGIGGTGIYGSITHVEQLCVNGLRVHLLAWTPVTRNGEPATREILARGQVVWIRGHVQVGRLYADRIDVLSTLVGPVGAIDPAARRIEVGRLAARVPASAILVDESGEPLSLASLQSGESLDVSGLYRPDGSLVATRIERVGAERGRVYSAPPLARLVREAAGLEQLSIEGYAYAPGAGSLRIDGVDFDTRALAPRALPESGARVYLRGELGPDRTLRASEVRPHLPEPPTRPRPPTPPTPAPQSSAPRRGLEASDLPGLFDAEPREPGAEPAPAPPRRLPIPGPRGEPPMREPIPPSPVRVDPVEDATRVAPTSDPKSR